MAQPKTLTLEVSDVSHQHVHKVGNIPTDATVGELVQTLLGQHLRLPPRDSNGQAVSYRAHLEREARHLFPSERVGDALQPDDRITLQPNIDAGGQR